MRILTSPNELESLSLPEPALRELRQQLAISGYNPQELCKLWQNLPARLIYFKEGDLPEVLLMGLLAYLPLPEGRTLYSKPESNILERSSLDINI